MSNAQQLEVRVVDFSGRIRSFLFTNSAGVVTLGKPVDNIKEARFRPARFKGAFDLPSDIRIGQRVTGQMEIVEGSKRGEIIDMHVYRARPHFLTGLFQGLRRTKPSA